MAHMPVANGVTEKDNGDQPQTISAEDVGVMPHDPDAVFRVLVGIISEQTGYPEDMIGIDLDVEAELGVDSIKRIEILGTFLSMLPKDKEAELVSQADLFVRIKQLRSLVEALVKALKGEDISVEIEEA
jgi:acyl carrier protein